MGFSVFERASLDFQYVFDMIAVQVAAASGRVLIRVPNTFYARELIRRLRPVDETDFTETGSNEVMWLELADDHYHQLAAPPSDDMHYPLVIWVEPTQSNVETQTRQMTQLLADDGVLVILFSRRLASLLPENRGAASAAYNQRVGAGIVRYIREANLRIRSQHSFHGPVSILWWQASIWLERFKRAALADRCWYAMRAAYRADGWQAPFSTLTLIMASRA